MEKENQMDTQLVESIKKKLKSGIIASGKRNEKISEIKQTVFRACLFDGIISKRYIADRTNNF